MLKIQCVTKTTRWWCQSVDKRMKCYTSIQRGHAIQTNSFYEKVLEYKLEIQVSYGCTSVTFEFNFKENDPRSVSLLDKISQSLEQGFRKSKSISG